MPALVPVAEPISSPPSLLSLRLVSTRHRLPPTLCLSSSLDNVRANKRLTLSQVRGAGPRDTTERRTRATELPKFSNRRKLESSCDCEFAESNRLWTLWSRNPIVSRTSLPLEISFHDFRKSMDETPRSQDSTPRFGTRRGAIFLPMDTKDEEIWDGREWPGSRRIPSRIRRTTVDRSTIERMRRRRSRERRVWVRRTLRTTVTTPCGIVLIAAADAGYCSSGLIHSGVRTRNAAAASRQVRLSSGRYASAVKELRQTRPWRRLRTSRWHRYKMLGNYA